MAEKRAKPKVPRWVSDPEGWRRHCRAAAFRGWLATLPPGGFEWTPADVAACIADYADDSGRGFSWPPKAQGVMRWLSNYADVIEAAGWSVSERRTAQRRLIRFTKVTKRKAHRHA